MLTIMFPNGIIEKSKKEASDMGKIFEKEISILTNDKPLGTDFHLCECGYEECRPNKPYEYILIDYWVIHYCVSGEGHFYIKDHYTHIHAGDVFIIPAHTKNKYFPDEKNPWIYQWIGLSGNIVPLLLKKCGLTPEEYALHHKPDSRLQTLFEQIHDNFHNERELKAIGITYQLLDYIRNNIYNGKQDHLTSGELYFQTALNYIQKNYPDNITISDIAAAANIDRTYVFKLFQKYTQQSPSQYLQTFRLEKACVLLRKSSLSITDTAYAVGFQQPAYFSKLFTQYKGISPSQYRKEFLRSYLENNHEITEKQT